MMTTMTPKQLMMVQMMKIASERWRGWPSKQLTMITIMVFRAPDDDVRWWLRWPSEQLIIMMVMTFRTDDDDNFPEQLTMIDDDDSNLWWRWWPFKKLMMTMTMMTFQTADDDGDDDFPSRWLMTFQSADDADDDDDLSNSWWWRWLW